jgi:glycolate oxidase FAD binding subunit
MSSAISLPVRLEKIVGADRVRAEAADLEEFAIDGQKPSVVLRPRSAEEIAEIVRMAASEKLALVACGCGSKLGIGMPPLRYDLALDMKGLTQIAHYDAGDLTLSVDAGKSLGALQLILREKGQFLPLDVPCIACATIGGTVASGIDSTLRQQYGTARDFLIGAEFIDGKGQVCKSGGRVVKNVSGYDLHKLLVGSLGTLAVITRLNFRTFPLPETCAGHLASFPNAGSALGYRTTLLKTGLPFANLEVLGPEFSAMAAGTFKATNQEVPDALSSNHWNVYAAYEGDEAIVKRVTRELEKLSAAAEASRNEYLSAAIKEELGGFSSQSYGFLIWASSSVALFRIVLSEFTAENIAEILRPAGELSLRAVFVLRACSVAYLALLAKTGDTSAIQSLGRLASEVFSTVAARRGTATLLHGPRSLKQAINVWGEKRPDFPLMQRVKQAFDPQNIFAPGRFVGGI